MTPSSDVWGGGTPSSHSGEGGLPHPVMMVGGTQSSHGVPRVPSPSGPGWGVPQVPSTIQTSDGVPPTIQTWDGVPSHHPDLGWGGPLTTQTWDGVTPPPTIQTWDGVPPPTR